MCLDFNFYNEDGTVNMDLVQGIITVCTPKKENGEPESPQND